MSIIEVLYRSSKIMHGHSVKGLRMVDGVFQADRDQNDNQPPLLELLVELDGCDSAAPMAQMEAYRRLAPVPCGPAGGFVGGCPQLRRNQLALAIGSALDLLVGFLSDRERARRPRPLHHQGYSGLSDCSSGE